MDARDIALQQSAPVVTVPRYGGFTPLTENGHRFLVTGDGLWLEARFQCLMGAWAGSYPCPLARFHEAWSSTSTGMPLIGVLKNASAGSCGARQPAKCGWSFWVKCRRDAVMCVTRVRCSVTMSIWSSICTLMGIYRRSFLPRMIVMTVANSRLPAFLAIAIGVSVRQPFVCAPMACFCPWHSIRRA